MVDLKHASLNKKRFLFDDNYRVSLFRYDNNEQGMLGYLKHAALNKNRFLFDDNYRVWNVCQNILPGKTACFMPAVYERVGL